MAAKAKKTTKNKKTTTKAVVKRTPKEPVIKSSVTGKKDACWDKPAIGKIVCLCVAIIAIIVVAAAIALRSQAITDDFFVSDGAKYVLNIPADENEQGAVATHVVYYYKDNTVTGAEYYYEFKDKELAKSFYELMSELISADEDGISKYKLNGKYVIMVADEGEYADMSASDVKSYIEFYEQILNSGDIEGDESEE
jgi:hypothetical protein